MRLKKIVADLNNVVLASYHGKFLHHLLCQCASGVKFPHDIVCLSLGKVLHEVAPSLVFVV